MGEADHRTVIANGSRLGAGVSADDPTPFFGPGTIYMACGAGGYVGLVRIEDGRLNLATALDADFVKRASGVGNAACIVMREAGFPPVDRLAELPWHGTPLLTRHASCPAGERVFLLGDAASYVEPFSGEGMAWALAAGINVVPFALRACEAWDPSLIRKWAKRYRQTILRRQWVSRTAAKVLREPMLVRMTVGAMNHFPGIAAPIVRYLNHARFW